MSRPLKYRFPEGDIRKDIPNYINRAGFQIPLKNSTGHIVSEARLNEIGILVLVEAVPETGKVITQSHGEVIVGKWTEVIDEQKTPEEIAAVEEAARQAAKPDHLKLSENKFFDLIDEINTAESLDIAYSDTVDVILIKASTAGLSMTRKAYYGMLLNSKLKEIEIYGGSWQGLPETKHILEG